MCVRIPLETYIFILNFSLPPRSEQVNGAVANEIKHVHSPEVIVVLDPRYDLSYKALYISTCSIALIYPFSLMRSIYVIAVSTLHRGRKIENDDVSFEDKFISIKYTIQFSLAMPYKKSLTSKWW